jgi:small GTP-binding protein
MDTFTNIYPAEFIQGDKVTHHLSFKLVVVGEPGVGKSCITVRAFSNTFDKNYSATVGFEFLSLNYKIDSKVVKLQVWDTCGQEVYRSLIKNFYKSSSLAISSLFNFE